MLDGIETFDLEIERVAKQHEDYVLFNALSGAGPSLTPGLMVAFGEQRERYKKCSRATTIFWHCTGN